MAQLLVALLPGASALLIPMHISAAPPASIMVQHIASVRPQSLVFPTALVAEVDLSDKSDAYKAAYEKALAKARAPLAAARLARSRPRGRAIVV